MTYYYNEKTKAFAVYTNFKPAKTPKGYKKITEEEYKELQGEAKEQGGER